MCYLTSFHFFLLSPEIPKHPTAASLSLPLPSMSFSRSQRSSGISPFRSRKSPAQPPPPAPKSTGRPLTPSSTTSSRPPSRLSSSPVSSGPSPAPHDRPETSRSKENVTVTVRFRPLRYRNNTVYLTCSVDLQWLVSCLSDSDAMLVSLLVSGKLIKGTR